MSVKPFDPWFHLSTPRPEKDLEHAKHLITLLLPAQEALELSTKTCAYNRDILAACYEFLNKRGTHG